MTRLSVSRILRLAIHALGLVPLLIASPARAIVTDLTLVRANHSARATHVDQDELLALIEGGQNDLAFDAAFQGGDGLFETDFTAIDGVGANVGQGQRFTRVPRADLDGPGEWKNHLPARATGPNASGCNHCHAAPSDDGAGVSSANVHRDPEHIGMSGLIERNTPPLFGAGGIQRLAEEMSATLGRIKAAATSETCRTGRPATRNLLAKEISFGTITATRTGTNPCVVAYDTSGVVGIDADLLVRPFQWKGSVAFVRDFNRGAAHNELGMQAVELVGDAVDGDFDGVTGEMTIGDMTAMAIYVAAQPRPTTRVELASLGLIPALPASETAAIQRGSNAFFASGCGSCHVSRLRIDNPIFQEPSQDARFRDAVFPGGQEPISVGVDPARGVTFDLTFDQPDNQIKDESGNVTFRLGAFQKGTDGRANVELFGDLKRHDMGAGLAEPIDETGSGASVFLTKNLWGVGSTAPYLHDGRATTLTEAILEHGGEAQSAKDAFVTLPAGSQADLIAFLNNLVLFKLPEEE